ncbi:hypothetical protein F4805DRAFT_451908 [Annulohypoxylon moriforme]|nr:hypothetical protein F4805DRAFT_451908 [Annulohypoxylon moriforme]
MKSSRSTKNCPRDTSLLSDDIIYHLAKHGIHEPQDIARLSRTCRSLSKILNPLIYRADVLETKQKLKECSGQFGCPSESWGRNPSYYYYSSCSDSMQWLLYPLMAVQKIPALHWAVERRDRKLGSEVAQKSIRAALKYWPFYFEVCCGGVGKRMDGMTPLHLAAMTGNEEILQQLLRASSVVDARVLVEFNFRKHIGDSSLSHTAWSHARPEGARHSCYMILNPLGLAILYGHVRVAETLAYATQDLVAEAHEHDTDLMSPLKMAILHKMPSVVRILLSRGYEVRGRDMYFDTEGLFQIAVANEGNEEVMRLLLKKYGSPSLEANDTLSPFGSALQDRFTSNLLFLAKHCITGSKPALFNSHMGRLIRSDEFLPIVKELLESDPEECRAMSGSFEIHLLTAVGMDLCANRGLMMQDYLLHHPNIDYSEDGLQNLLQDQERRRECRERIRTATKSEERKMAKLRQEIYSNSLFSDGQYGGRDIFRYTKCSSKCRGACWEFT